VTTPSDSIIELVQALTSATQEGRVRWEPADATATTFLAQRPSGAVVLAAARPGAVMPASAVRLSVRDPNGETLDEYVSNGGGFSAVDVQLSDLYHHIKRQSDDAQAAVRALASEFRTAVG
jgi:hypothetical protein